MDTPPRPAILFHSPDKSGNRTSDRCGLETGLGDINVDLLEAD
jgi:hypothetical protein